MHADDRGSIPGFGAKPRQVTVRHSIFLWQFDASAMRPELAGREERFFRKFK
jgi:hypothetical protein